jgi:hypothetical protein
MKTLVKISLVFIAVSFFMTSVYAQQTTKQIKQAAKAAHIKKSVETRNYTFIANYAIPMRGGQRYLTDEYDLRVVQDSVIAWLPYFGRVYMDPPMNPNDAGIKFTSTKFDYAATSKKKGGWEILITPKNEKYTSKLRLTVFTDGTASLLVSSNYRDQITFTGYVKEDSGKK